MAEFDMSDKEIAQVTERYENLTKAMRGTRGEVNALTDQVAFMEKVFSESLSVQDNFATGLQTIEGRVSTFIKEAFEDRLSSQSEFVAQSLSLQETLALAKTVSEEDLANMLKESYGIRLEDLSEFLDKSLQLEKDYTFLSASAEEGWKGAAKGLKELSAMMDDAAKDSQELAVVQRSIAMAKAVIDTMVGANQALASGVPPWSFIAMASVVAAGMANVGTIASTLIPSFETGGRFVVPDVYPVNRVDSTIMRVNPGEEVNVTPRGMTGEANSSFNFTFMIDGIVLSRIINKQARAGELYTLRLAERLA